MLLRGRAKQYRDQTQHVNNPEAPGFLLRSTETMTSDNLTEQSLNLFIAGVYFTTRCWPCLGRFGFLGKTFWRRMWYCPMLFGQWRCSEVLLTNISTCFCPACGTAFWNMALPQKWKLTGPSDTEIRFPDVSTPWLVQLAKRWVATSMCVGGRNGLINK